SANHHVLSTQVARELRAMLTEVVRSGTGHAAAVPGYDVYGKTGTARIPQPVAHDGDGYMDANGHYHYDATFVGGIDGGDLSIIVVLNEPTKSIYASDAAAPVFARLASYALRAYRIPPPAFSGVDQVTVPPVSPSALAVAGTEASTESADPTP
ncbi:MAG TPA: penicillin-binding transpeptidase domain-containing protein, partial [Acidimicrobiales bacterium]